LFEELQAARKLAAKITPAQSGVLTHRRQNRITSPPP
jgi:hypothetical protein